MALDVRPLKPAASGLEQGMIFMAVAVLTAPISHAIAKSLGSQMAPGQITLARLLVQILILAAFFSLSGSSRLPVPTVSQVLRGVLLASASLSYFWAVTLLPLADASAIYFVSPFLLTLFASVFLGEKLGLRRITAVAVGFSGALIVTRPSFEQFGAAALLPFLSAIFVAIVFTLTRAQNARETPLALQFWMCCSGAVAIVAAMGLGAPLNIAFLALTPPAPVDWALLIVLGLIGTVTQLLATKAIRLAPAGALAPLQYLEILSASLLGYFVFSDVPDRATLTGIAIIVAAGLYMFYRERQLSRGGAGGQELS
ncbi:DMT family transporter [Labrenzia sp. VG12]|uniref:DMT family transporter n=1 Tax=Labrenzia sp. VG12 TaxID=2021862 RepID=UPI000B8BF4D6|nr:DMT family transporter [Labrenzia sp. VG12]ASP32030.1 EamA family transporter [Labrenzia sp. VG12]